MVSDRRRRAIRRSGRTVPDRGDAARRSAAMGLRDHRARPGYHRSGRGKALRRTRLILLLYAPQLRTHRLIRVPRSVLGLGVIQSLLRIVRRRSRHAPIVSGHIKGVLVLRVRRLGKQNPVRSARRLLATPQVVEQGAVPSRKLRLPNRHRTNHAARPVILIRRHLSRFPAQVTAYRNT